MTLTRKAVEKTVRKSALIIGVFLLLKTTIAGAAEPYLKLIDSRLTIHNKYQSGMLIFSSNTAREVVEAADADGKITTTTTTATAISTYHAGNVRPDTVNIVNTTEDREGNVLSKSEYTDTYTYGLGLYSVSGTGTYEAYATDKEQSRFITVEEIYKLYYKLYWYDLIMQSYYEIRAPKAYMIQLRYVPDNEQSRSGTITRSFVVKNGQALLTVQVTSGTIKDRDDTEIGTFRNTTTIAEADYDYRGGEWVPMKKVSKSEYEMMSGGKKGDKEEITRTFTYTRNEYGTISGISQTASGTQVKKDKVYELSNYTAVVKFDSRLGWYIADETYEWKPVLVVSPTSLSFGEIIKGQSKTMSFTVKNDGGGTLTVSNITTDKTWIGVSPTNFSLGAGESKTISVTVSPTRELSDNVTYTGTVSVTSNGGSATVSISVIPTCAIAYPEPISLSSGKELTFWGTGVPYGTIRIYTLTGELVRELRETNGNDKITWDLTNEQGEKVVRGIYLYTASNPKEPKGNRGKITVVK